MRRSLKRVLSRCPGCSCVRIVQGRVQNYSYWRLSIFPLKKPLPFVNWRPLAFLLDLWLTDYKGTNKLLSSSAYTARHVVKYRTI